MAKKLTPEERKKLAAAKKKTDTRRNVKVPKANADTWNEAFNVEEELQWLYFKAKRFIDGKVKLNREQALILKDLINKFSDKMIPTAKAKEKDNEVKKIKIGGKLPDGLTGKAEKVKIEEEEED